MHRVILPFGLGSSKNKKAVSSSTFTVDSQIQNFSRISVSRLKFMKLYQEEKFNLTQYPFTDYWGDIANSLSSKRAIIAVTGSSTYASEQFGHPSNLELRAMDDMPHIIEIRIKGLTKNRDNNSSKRHKHAEYQTIDTEKDRIEDVNDFQTMLVYSANISYNNELHGFQGSISCDMKDLGSFNIKDKGFGDTFTIEVSMFNFRGLALSHVPSCELTLLFR